MAKKALDLRKLATSVFLCIAVGSLGSVFTAPAIGEWYPSLAKPAWTPPDWVFGPVWTTLFILMGIALYLVWGKGLKAKGVKPALEMFCAQFALNVLWSFLFFGLRSPLYGLAGIIFLWIAIAATIWRFYLVSKPAAYAMIPYIAWVTIAAALNYSVFALNA
ncbi:MAG: TspO/MBR family protein [Candidatus Aenigmatarchaeota archaeon]